MRKEKLIPTPVIGFQNASTGTVATACAICGIIWDSTTAGAAFSSMKNHMINTHGWTDGD